MSSAEYSFELFIPLRKGKQTIASSVPFAAANPMPGWQNNGGEIRWVIEGVTLIDKDYGFYPGNQLDDVLDVVAMAMSHQSRASNTFGEIIGLRAEPLTLHHARFTYDVKASQGNRAFNHPAIHREVTGNIRKTARSVLDALAAIFEHLDASVPPRPPGVPPTHGYGRQSIYYIVARVLELEQALSAPERKKH